MSVARKVRFFLIWTSMLTVMLTWLPVAALAENSLVLLEDINTGVEHSLIDYLTDVDGLVFFAATSLVPGQTNSWERRLWVSNGEPGGIWGGTWMIDGSFSPSITAKNPVYLVNVNGTLFFSAEGYNYNTNPIQYFGFELWRSDGTIFGTTMVKDIVSGSASSNPTNLVKVGNGLFFAANGGNGAGNELWKSDGIPGGITTMVRDINPGTPGSMGKIAAPVDVGGTLFFWADDGTHGYELWKSDGTASGTVLVKDINPTPGVSSTSFDPNPANILGSKRDRIFNPINLNGTLYFTADDGTHGVELWKSDGTIAGTVMVADINSDPTAYLGDSTPGWLTEMGGDLYFTAYAKSTGRELWKLDTATGVLGVVDDINPGASSSRDEFDDVLVDINGTLFFSAFEGLHGRALWKTDGTSLGTTMIADPDLRKDGWAAVNKLTRAGNILFFAGSDAAGVELWHSDGTLAGTWGIDVNPGLDGGGQPNSSVTLITGPRGIDFVGSGGRLFAPLDGGTFGDELWATVDAVPPGFDLGRIRIVGGDPLLPQPGADVAATVASSRGQVGTNQFFSYAISVENKGPKKIATGVKVTDTLPAGTSFMWQGGSLFVPPACTSGPGGGVVTCEVGNLAKGKKARFTLIVQAPTVTGVINNSVSATSKSADPNPFNDSDFTLTTVVAPSAGVDLSVTKNVALDPVLPGTPILFDLNVFNGGADDASGVVLTDVLPAEVIFVAVDSTPTGLCAHITGTITCNIGALASGDAVRISIMATAPITEGAVLNTASVTSAETDTDPTNNQAQVTVAVPEPSSGSLTLIALITVISFAGRKRTNP